MTDYFSQDKGPHGIPPGNSGAGHGNQGSMPGKKSNPIIILVIAVAIVVLIVGIIAVLLGK